MGVDYSKWPLLVEACMEWIAMRWTKSMIKAELRDHFKNDINLVQVNAIIKAANAEIKRMYNIDASEYRGRQISFYELVIREEKYLKEIIKLVDRIKCAERLDKLFGLEVIQPEDADAIAQRVRDALIAMDQEQISEVPDDARDKLKRLRETYNDAQRKASVEPAGDGQATTNSEQPDGQQEPSTPETGESKETSESPKADNPQVVDTSDIEDVASLASLADIPPEVMDLISNPDNDKKFDEFEKRKKRRKDI